MQEQDTLTTKSTRRQMLAAAGVSLAAFGLGTQVAAQKIDGVKESLPDYSGTPEMITQSNGAWKYLPIDPKKAADDSYNLFAEGACHYASFRAIITNVAQALLATGKETDAALAQNYLAFPFYMMVYGQAGLAFYGSLCGALNGCAAALSVFVPNRDDKFAMIQDLSIYYEETPLPIYVPKVDKYPGKMPPNAAKSILCHLSLDKWIKSTGNTLEGYTRVERCIRLTCDTVIKTVELLNAYHADKAKTIAGAAALLPATQSCVECHTHNQGRFDSISKMSCVECHPEPQTDRACPRK
jgi:hypothetical protein